MVSPLLRPLLFITLTPPCVLRTLPHLFIAPEHCRPPPLVSSDCLPEVEPSLPPKVISLVGRRKDTRLDFSNNPGPPCEELQIHVNTTVTSAMAPRGLPSPRSCVWGWLCKLSASRLGDGFPGRRGRRWKLRAEALTPPPSCGSSFRGHLSAL
uniref:Uncharacterized protein n=1 Tax=Knipowitschia caucasica TaxID=637954 RepID=A0AAV2K4W0_KNICA